MGETTVYMFAESGSAKEQWYAALMSAVAPQGLLATTQHLYEDYCRYMASLQIVQPPPLPPPPPPPAMLQPWRFRTRNMEHGRQNQHKEQRQQQQEEQRHPHHQEQLQQEQQQQRSGATSAPRAPGAPAAATAIKGPQPHAPTGKDRDEEKVDQQRQQQQGQHPLQTPSGPFKSSAELDPVATARQRGGRNPFGFILSRFARSTCRRSDNPVATHAAAVVAPATTPETPFSKPPSPVGSQTSIHPSEAAQEALQQRLLGRVSEQQQGQQEMLQGRSEGNLPVDSGQWTSMDHDAAGCQAFSRPTGTADSNASSSACQPLQPSSSSPQQLPLSSEQRKEVDQQERGEVTSFKALDASVAPDFSTLSACRDVSDIFTASRPFSQSCQVRPGDAIQVPSAAAAASIPVKQGRHLAVSDGSTAVGIACLRAEPTFTEASGGRNVAALATSTVAASKGIAAAMDGDMSLSVHSRASNAYASSSAGMGAVAAVGLVHMPHSGHTEPSFNSWSQLQVAGTTGLMADVADADIPMLAPAEQPRSVTTPEAPSSSSSKTFAVAAGGPVLGPPDAGIFAAGEPGIPWSASQTASAALQAATAEAAAGESAGAEAMTTAASGVLEKKLQTAAAPSEEKQQRTPLGTWGCAQDHLQAPVSSRLALEAPSSWRETSGSSPCKRSPTAGGSSTTAPQLSHKLAVAAAAVAPSWTGVSMSLPLLVQQSRNGSSMQDLGVTRWAAEGQDPGGEVSRDSRIMKAAAGTFTAKTALSWRSLDHCLGEGSSISKGHGPMDFTQGAQQPILHDESRHTMSLRGLSLTESLAPETSTAGALLSGSSCNGAGSVPPRVVAWGEMPNIPSQHDLKRMQREEQERLKQENQRAKAAARATEGARRAEQRAARERARSEARYRRLEVEAKARQAKERARALKQKLTSAKSLQDLATAAATSATSEPSSASVGAMLFATETVPHRYSSGGRIAVDSAPIPSRTDNAVAKESAPVAQAPGIVKSATGDGVEAEPEGVHCSGQEFAEPSVHVPLPAPPAPPRGALVDGLYGLNMLLVRIGFEFLRRRGFSGWLHRLIQSKLERVRRPGFLDKLNLRRFDLGFTAPQLRNIRAVAGPNNCAPDGSTWPQLALDLIWLGDATATVSTKIDFDRVASNQVDQPAATGSTSEPVAMMPTAPHMAADTISGMTSGEAAAIKAKSVSIAPPYLVAVPVTAPLPAVAAGHSRRRTADEVAEVATPAAVTLGDVPRKEYESLPSLENHAGAITDTVTSLPAGTRSCAASSGSNNADGESGPALTPVLLAQPQPALVDEAHTPSVPLGAEQPPDAARTESGAGRASRVAGRSGGGGFWMNFIPFFALLRKAGQALASNLAGSLSGTPVEVHLQARRFECTLLLWLAPPPSDRLWLSFAEPPKMDFTVTPVLGNRKLSGALVVGRLSAWVRSKVTDGLSRAMVYPACVDVRMGKLLLSIDSPGDAVRPFMPPPTRAPTQAFVPISPAELPASPSHQHLPQNLNTTSAPELGAPDQQPPAAAGSGAQLPFQPPSCPSRPPLVPTSGGDSSLGMWPGEASRAATSVMPLQTQPTASSIGGATSNSAFVVPALATVAANGSAAVGSSSSLLENALHRIFCGTSSIWNSSPGTLSPMDGMSEGDDEDEGGEARNGEKNANRRQQTENDPEEMYNGRRPKMDHGDGCDAGLTEKLGFSTDNMENCSAEWFLPHGNGWAGWVPAAGSTQVDGVSASCRLDSGPICRAGDEDKVMECVSQHIEHLNVCDTLALAPSSSLIGSQLRPAQAPQGQASKRRNGGPLHWMRGVAGLVAHGVGGVGNAGIRGLGAVGSIMGHAMLRPVVNAGGRAVVHQQLQAMRESVGPSVAQSKTMGKITGQHGFGQLTL
ncbi:hypothetical protein Vafri_20932 [Volvox africanus]|nr:hypothetical protein Vafri_20932 [Volvox africanus]